MIDTEAFWPAVKLGSDGINLVGDAEMESICSWLVELAESTTGGQLQDLYPGYFFTTYTQVDDEDIYLYALSFFPMDVIQRGGLIEESEERFRIDLLVVGDDFHLAVLAPRELLFRERNLNELFSIECFNDELFPIEAIRAAAFRFKLSDRLQ